MHITVIGIGYVGLVTATCLAEAGHHVVALDIDEKKIFRLQQGEIPIYEPGLQEMVVRNRKEKRLFFTTDYSFAISSSLVCFIAVDTPSLFNGKADLTAFQKVCLSIAEYMTSYKVIVNKSTVPVGTSKKTKNWILKELEKRGKEVDFDVVSNPEFLKEGNAIQDFLKPDRVIIGTESKKASLIMKEVYAPFMWSRERFIFMDASSSETTKYAANAMLATRISFMDELSHFCEKSEADIHKVRQGIGSDPRIGYDFLWPGIGYGGSCLPKDVKALIAQAEEKNCSLKILQQVDLVNQEQPKKFLHKIYRYFSKKIKGKIFGVLGLSFKPGTDDMRFAPSLVILKDLLQKGCCIQAYDPVSIENAKEYFPPSPQMKYCFTEEEVALNADAILLLTEWKQFRGLPMENFIQKMRGKAFFDGRNQYSSEKMHKIGFDYLCIGKPSHFQEKVDQDLQVLISS